MRFGVKLMPQHCTWDELLAICGELGARVPAGAESTAEGRYEWQPA